MKKLLIIFTIALSLTAFAAEKNTITIMQPKCDNAMMANVVKSSLTMAFAKSEEWQPMEEMSPDQMLKVMERNSDQLSQYMLMTTIQTIDGKYLISCRIMEMATMATMAIVEEMSDGSPRSMLQACESIEQKLLKK